MGTIRPFHSASLRLKPGRERTRRGTRLNFTPWPLNRMAQASQVQRSLRLRQLDQVGMTGDKPDAAQLAALQRPFAARKLAQRAKAVGGFRKLSRTHDLTVAPHPARQSERLALGGAAEARQSAPCGSAVTRRELPINLSRATNPEAGFSSKPSMTSEARSGAAS